MESCETCKVYWVDQEDVELNIGTNQLPILRGEGMAPKWTDELCKVCSKPDRGLEDWTKQNERMWYAYNAASSIGATDAEKNDNRFRHNCGLIWSETKILDRMLDARDTANQITATLTAVLGGK